MARHRPLFLGAVLLAGPVSASSGFSEGEILAGGCGGCHGHTGVSVAPSMPSIAGFDRRYLARVMREFQTGVRFSTVMGRLMEGYSTREIAQLAGYFSEQAWEGAAVAAEAASVEPGRRIHEAKCEECHEQAGRYQDRDMPRLAGQQPQYLRIQMTLRRDGTEGMQQPSRMREALQTLSDADILALSRFLASQD